jgi:protein subunit release factor A
MEIHLTKKDFRIEWFSGTGAGGQYRNKHQNCCRITHIESGLSAIATDRERTSNQRKAFQELAKRLLAMYQLEELSSKIPIVKEVIRNYNKERNEVHDKASGLKMPYVEVVEKNFLAPMIEARRNIIPEKKCSH